MPLGLSVIKV